MLEHPRRTFRTLDGMRGAAAFAVMTHHAGWLFGPLHMRHAYMAVDLFFVLSGFVLAFAYQARFEAGMSAAAFMRMRLIRLYPLYLLGIVFSGAWIAFNLFFQREVFLAQTQSWTWEQFRTSLLHSIFFLPSPTLGAGPPALYPLNIAAWSLLFELVINGVYALLWRWLTPRVLVALVTVSAIWLGWDSLHHGSLNHGWTWNGVGVALSRVCFSFFAGVLIHFVAQRLSASMRVSPYVLIALMLVLLYVKPPAPFLGVYDLLCAIVLFPLLVLLGTRTEPGTRAQAVFAFSGLVSYALYAVHYPLIFVATDALLALGLDAGNLGPWSGLVFSVLVIAGCWLLDRFYDVPLRAVLSPRPAQRAFTR
ncbi:acyltransferase family protein [Hyalangium rubrum]|uniref:Acyltransferase n=1 Tax=Hyalangium rubrum TaxID=3103134 RepID=A0ABU5HAV4_9BACT|nr:acyltransferase [Hyalangium sp. s54d21]MDY7230601.1 acyltransferase [Hyalangium sp. s54d21]